MLIHITGASGSGTSTLGKAVAEALQMNFLDGDDYYWVDLKPPFLGKRCSQERAELLRHDLFKSRHAVLAGSIMGWDEKIEDSFDLIVFLYLEASVRVERLRAREIERFGQADQKFLEWAAQYDGVPTEGRSLTKHRAWLEQRTCPVIELRGNLSVDERLSQVIKHVADPFG